MRPPSFAMPDGSRSRCTNSITSACASVRPATSENLHAVIPGSELVEPPWGDNEWNERGAAARDGTGALFERWPLLAPQLLEFAAR